MNKRGSLLDELRVRYEEVQEPTDDHGDVESFEAIDVDQGHSHEPRLNRVLSSFLRSFPAV